MVILKPLGNNEGNSHGALSEDCLSHLFLISMREILTSKGYLKFYIFLGECALTLLLAHGVGILPLNAPDLLEVFKCLRWVSSLMADSTKIVGAVDQLPLRESGVGDSQVVDVPECLKGPYG